MSSLSDLLAFMTSNGLDGVVRPAPSLAGMLISGDSAASLAAVCSNLGAQAPPSPLTSTLLFLQALSRAEGPGDVAFVAVACPEYDPNAPGRWWADTAPVSSGSCTSNTALQV